MPLVKKEKKTREKWSFYTDEDADWMEQSGSDFWGAAKEREGNPRESVGFRITKTILKNPREMATKKWTESWKNDKEHPTYMHG